MSTTTVTQTEKKIATESSTYRRWLIIFGILTLAGVVAWFTQLSKGLILTDLGDHKVWGLYIVGFMFFTGIAAGSLIMASLPYVANLSSYKPYTKIASFVTAVTSVIAAGLFIMVDIGNPDRLWNFIIHANFQSPMVWDSIILLSYAFFSIYFLSRLIGLDTNPADEKSVKKWAWAAFIAALLVGITANVFGLQISKPAWYSAIQPFSFLVAAIVVGFAFMILLSLLLRSKQYITMGEDLLSKIGKATAIFLILDLVMIVSELITAAYPGTTEGLAYIQYMLAGGGAALFWIQVVSAVLAIILLLASVDAKRLGLGAFLALAAIFLQKFSMLLAAFALPVINYPGPIMQGGSGYFPSIIEIGVSVGIISLGALFLMIGFKRLPLQFKGPRV